MDFLKPETWSLQIKVALSILGVLLFISILSFIMRPNTLHIDLKDLIIEASQMYEISKQDSDPSISLQHSTAALTFLSVCRKLASDSSILEATKVNPSELERLFKIRQSEAISSLSKKEDSTITSILAGYSSL